MNITKISLLDSAATSDWDAYVGGHANATPCHLSSWLTSLRDTYSFEPILYVAKDEAGQTQGIFPLFRISGAFTGIRIVSLPFSDYGGPLCTSAIVEKALVERVRQDFRSGIKYLEIRGGISEPKDMQRYNYYKRHALDLRKGIAQLQAKIDKKTILYNIRRAEKAGVVVRQENSRAGMDAFYHLNSLTRRKHGVPCQPRAFFENLFAKMIVPNFGFILVAEHESRIAAASLFLIIGKHIHYKYSASDPILLRKLSPNHLLTWSAISWGVENGYESLDFGRTSPDNVGLIRYKNMWGMEDLELPYYYYPHIHGAVATKESGIGYRMATAMWRHLPLSVLEMSSSIIYKHLG